jgi:hypothetical protein
LLFILGNFLPIIDLIGKAYLPLSLPMKVIHSTK